jgi:hypothetical protein
VAKPFQIVNLAAVAVISFSFASAAMACEPIWVRPVHVANYQIVFLGRVEAVDWFHGEITVVPIKALVGKPVRVKVRYNNIPLTCAWQSFWVGDQVYVFDAEWAASADKVTFAPRS